MMTCSNRVDISRNYFCGLFGFLIGKYGVVVEIRNKKLAGNLQIYFSMNYVDPNDRIGVASDFVCMSLCVDFIHLLNECFLSLIVFVCSNKYVIQKTFEIKYLLSG